MLLYKLSPLLINPDTGPYALALKDIKNSDGIHWKQISRLETLTQAIPGDGTERTCRRLDWAGSRSTMCPDHLVWSTSPVHPFQMNDPKLAPITPYLRNVTLYGYFSNTVPKTKTLAGSTFWPSLFLDRHGLLSCQVCRLQIPPGVRCCSACHSILSSRSPVKIQLIVSLNETSPEQASAHQTPRGQRELQHLPDLNLRMNCMWGIVFCYERSLHN